MAKPEKRAKARELRKQGWTITEIASELSVARSSVSLWVRDIELTDAHRSAIKQRSRHWGAQNRGAQHNRQKALSQRKAYQDAGRQRARESSTPLHLAGCMLYWAEGAKTKKNAVHFVNSDPHMMVLFMRFLRDELQVSDDLFRLQIHCHTQDDAEIQRIEQYWLDLLRLDHENLQQTRYKEGSNSRKNRLENGVCALQVFRTEVVHHIYGAIQEYAGFENPDWLF